MIRKPRTRGKAPASKREGGRYVRVAPEEQGQMRDKLLAKGKELGLPHVQCGHIRAGAKLGAMIHSSHAVNLELCTDCAREVVEGIGPAYLRLIGRAAEAGNPPAGYDSARIEGGTLSKVLDAVKAAEPDAHTGYLILQFLAAALARGHGQSKEETAEQAVLSWEQAGKWEQEAHERMGSQPPADA